MPQPLVNQPQNPGFAPLPEQDPNQQQVLDPRRQMELIALIQQLQSQNQANEFPVSELPQQRPIDGTTSLSAGLGAAGNALEGIGTIIAQNRKNNDQITKNKALSQALAQQGGF